MIWYILLGILIVACAIGYAFRAQLQRGFHQILKRVTNGPQWFKATIPFMASVFGAILLRLYQVSTAQQTPTNLNEWILWSLYFLAALLFLLPFLHLLLSIKIENDRRIALDDKIAVADAIRFRTRTDTVIVENPNTVILSWDMQLDSDSEVTHSHIEFPIYLEIDANEDPAQKLKLLQLTVNGENVANRSIVSCREIRKPVVANSSSPSLLVTTIRIPVKLGKTAPYSHVYLSVETCRAFPKLLSPEIEYLFVEIPFLTRVLHVDIRAGTEFRKTHLLQLVGKGKGTFVEAESYFLRSLDSAEIDRVLKEGIQEVSPAPRIEFDYPKTGYQYCFFFNACPIPQVTPNPTG